MDNLKYKLENFVKSDNDNLYIENQNYDEIYYIYMNFVKIKI